MQRNCIAHMIESCSSRKLQRIVCQADMYCFLVKAWEDKC
jgi:hypothetical protein